MFTTRPDTIFGASFVAVAADHPIAQAVGGGESRSRGVHRAVQAGRHHRGRARNAGEARLRHRADARRIRLIRLGELPVYIANFVLMDYGTGAVFGVPAHDQRDFEFAQQIRPADPPRRLRRRQDRSRISPMPKPISGPGTLVNSHFLDGMDVEDAKRAVIRRAEAGGWGNRARPSSACATGASAASVTGARRSRSSIATRAARCRCRAINCRWCCPRMSASTSPATRSTAIRPGSMSHCPKCGGAGAARDRHARHVRRFVVVFHPLRQPARGQAVRPRSGRAMAAGRAVYRRGRACDPALALCALLDARAQAYRTCSTWPSRSPGCSPRAW